MQHLGSTIRISIFPLALVAVIGVTGCGGSGGGGGGSTGGLSGGRAGGNASGGRGQGGQPGSEGGTGASVVTSGGRGGPGGGQATGSAGTRGGAGGAPGNNPCGTTPSVCSAGAKTCAAGVPQDCVADLDGCTSWRPQPACSAAQLCNPTTGACECRDDPACGDPPQTGDFCPEEGAGTHSTCVKGVDGCYTVMTGVLCASDKTCDTDSPTTIVSQGVVCGCPPVVPSSGNQGTLDESVKLLGTGCTPAQATASARIGSPGDDAVLFCLSTNNCPIWQVTTNCGAQQLTGGIDPLTTLPACVCRKPAKAGQYFVDPNPTMAPLMTGPPTGVQYPAACRFQTLTTALKQQGPPATEVVAQHEGSSNVHFRTKAGTPGVPDCSAPNSCERFPMEIPAGVHLYTADAGSFNPSHYVIDVDQVTTTADYALLLNDKVTLEGFTIDASAMSASGVNAGGGATYVVASPAQGAWKGTPAVALVTAALNQVRILGNAIGTSTGSVAKAALVPAPVPAQIVMAVRGQAHWTANYLSIVGGAGTGRGILVDHATDGVAGSTAMFTASHLNVVLAGATGTTALSIGTNVAADAGNVVVVTNDATDHGTSALKVGDLGTAVLITGGTATFTSVDVGSTGGRLRGYDVWGSNAPAGVGVTINQGSITASPGTDGGIGVHVRGGLTTINGAHITGPQASVVAGAGSAVNWIGVNVEQAPTQTGVAGEVTLTGTEAAKTIIDTAPLPLANATAVAGVVVGSGLEAAGSTRLPRLNITGNTTVTGHLDGIVVNNGRVIVAGSGVASTGNWRDGVQVFSTLNLVGTDPSDPPSRVSITGASVMANGRLGVLVRDIAPVALDGVKIVGNGVGAIAGNGLKFPNGTGGVDVQRSQPHGGASGFLFNLLNSTISGNAGCGVTLSGGDDTGVNRTSSGDPGVRICGVGVSSTNVPGPVVASVSSNPPMVTTPGALATNIGGKVSAVLRNNTIQNNSGVGLYITEARDFDPSSADDDVTEATIQGNTVTGNLTVVPAVGSEPAAGGIYVAASNFTNAVCSALSTDCTSSALSGVLTAEDLGCEDYVTSVDTSVMAPRKNHTACTRVTMGTFVGNTIECNGRAQLGYAIPQRGTTSAAGSGWDISSNASIVGVTLADRCTAAAMPNRLAGYSAVLPAAGLVIPSSATDPSLRSLVHVGAYAVFWNSSTPAVGTDYSASLAAAPRGNNDAASWGVCPGATPVTCPVPVAP